jgi:hypothetical protein
MGSRRASIILILAAVPTFFVAKPVLAQGHGHGHGASGPSAVGAAPLQQTTAADVRNFASWLDDASIAPPGNGTVNVSFGYYRTPLFHEMDMPVVDGGVGLARRVQFGFSVPYYHLTEGSAPAAHGLGDVYLNAKVQLRNPSAERNGVGFAIIPLVEILNNPRPDQSRVNWALPASVEVQRPAWRAYASGGYFSRGSLFASGAVELTVTEHAWMTCSGSSSYSTKIDPAGQALGLSRGRTDISVGMSYATAPSVALFGSIGRTLSRQDANAGSVVISGGASFGFSAWRPKRIPNR